MREPNLTLRRAVFVAALVAAAAVLPWAWGSMAKAAEMTFYGN